MDERTLKREGLIKLDRAWPVEYVKENGRTQEEKMSEK